MSAGRRPPRIVTAASLFDGHDAAINIMRRILQASGAEVIHLGHNRSVQEIVDCALQEDAHAVAITSYQGGHVEFFKYMVDLFRQSGERVEVFGGGGGTILPTEIDELHAYGVTRIYSPDDGRAMGLQGMIDDLLRRCDFEKRPAAVDPAWWDRLDAGDPRGLAALITAAEDHPGAREAVRAGVAARGRRAPVLGVTGTGGAGKSSLVDELILRLVREHTDARVAVVSVDPTRRRSGGALLGDRIRMNSLAEPRVFMRSLATRGAHQSLSAAVQDAVGLCAAAGYDLIVLESSGIGQSDTDIVAHCDVSLYVMTSEYGAATQLEKIDMLDFADAVAINKFEKRGAEDALRDVRKQVRRNKGAWDLPDAELPVFGTIASQFADPGVTALYAHLMGLLADRAGAGLRSAHPASALRPAGRPGVIPPDRQRYLAEIVEAHERNKARVGRQMELARRLQRLDGAIAELRGAPPSAAPMDLEPRDGDPPEVGALLQRHRGLLGQLDPDCRAALAGWPAEVEAWGGEAYRYVVRGKTLEQPLTVTSLSGSAVRRVSLPRLSDWGDLLRWRLFENLPGAYPYTAGVFPLKREGEDPARMFAGEGGPERTNKRFHYVSRGLPARRLSTAFDSVTLYGEDPDERPDIYGKVGNSGVSVCTLDDAKKLYSGFDLCAPTTSVSMTINGPAPVLLAFFLNAAIDQQVERRLRETGRWAAAVAELEARAAAAGLPRPRYDGELPEGNDGLGLGLLGASGADLLPADEYAEILASTVSRVRGTVQADILKEDQAQNTCIFSTEFALRMQGDIQAWFVEHEVRNFYSVSISGYHIAEAGANPITQLAFTLANGFTFVEYFLSRGMKIDDFAPNLSFFFSNGMDPEYAVIGRVARRIWARAMKQVYGAGPRSQMLKYHIQTSGRSLHAQEVAFNDIRTTLQALYAIYDNCNSLHTNAYDEAITTPTEESVRRALAIQLIINKELGSARNENPLQGSFFIEELTDLIEEAVMAEFRRLSDRGGVLGAMERMYQRSKIQDESLHYETLKHTGELPLIGVNTFLDDAGSPTVIRGEVIRAHEAEKRAAIDNRRAVMARSGGQAGAALRRLQEVALRNPGEPGANTFTALMEAARCCTLGQISGALYQVGGKYRRNM
jgi:methylmalonyl-CoA mutase